MSDSEDSSVVPVDLTNVSTLRDLYQHLRDSGVPINIESAIHNQNSQTIFIHMQNVIRNENLDRQQSSDVISAEERIRNLSETYKCKYPELRKNFSEWKRLRRELISVLETSAHKLDRNLSLASGFRIITSVTDILGTSLQYYKYPVWPLPKIIMESAPVLGLLAHVAERLFFRKIHSDVDEAMEKDQEYFNKIVEWIKQTRELDEAVRDFFPYGIDKDILMKIHKRSTECDDVRKMFITILLSNIKEDHKLLEDIDFLRKADNFSTSEAGKMWFKKEILEDGPYSEFAYNSRLCNKIQHFNDEIADLEEKMKKKKSTGKDESTLDVLKISLGNHVRAKHALNAITIINILLKEKPREVISFRKIAKTLGEELEKISTVVSLLNPERPLTISDR